MGPFPKHLLHPRYWFTWLLLGIWWFFAQLPYAVQWYLGKIIARFMPILARRRTHIARCNLKICFPEKSAEERVLLLKQNLHAVVMGVLETGMAWFWSKKRLQQLIQIEGLENLDAIEGSGALLLGVHFTSLEMAGVCVNSHITRLDMMYRAHKNELFDFVQRNRRGRHNNKCKLILRKDVRDVLRRLKQGRIVWYAPDQDYGLKQGVFAPFFGVQAATITATSRFARIANVPVLPIFDTRLPNGVCKVRILPPLENFPSNDDVLDATRINALVESFIRQQPEQYLWVHRRFKNRPEGSASVY